MKAFKIPANRVQFEWAEGVKHVNRLFYDAAKPKIYVDSQLTAEERAAKDEELERKRNEKKTNIANK